MAIFVIKIISLYSLGSADFFVAFYGGIVALIEGGKKGKGRIPYPSDVIMYRGT